MDKKDAPDHATSTFWDQPFPRARLMVPVLVLFAIGFRLWGISWVGLSHDESLSHYYALHSVGWILEHCATWINHPPLFFLLLHGWLGLIPPFNQFMVESLNVFFAVLTVLVFYRWSALLFSEPWSLILSLVLVLHPFHVYYSTVLRMYCLALFGLTAAGYAMTLILYSNSGNWKWVLWLLGSIVALYSHSFTGLFVATMIAVLGIHQWTRGEMGGWALSVFLLLCLYLPWFTFVVKQALRISQDFWLPDFHPLQVLILGFWWGGYVGSKDPGWETLARTLVVCSTFFAPFIWSLTQWRKKEVWTLWLVGLAPLAFVVLLSLTGQSVLLYRTFLFSLPFVLLLWGHGIREFPMSLKTVLAVGFVFFLGFTSIEMKLHPPFQYAKKLPGWIRSNRPPNAFVLHAGRYSYFASIFYNRYQLPEYLYGQGNADRATERDVQAWRKTRPVLVVFGSSRLHEAPMDRRLIQHWKSVPGAKIKRRSWEGNTFTIIHLPPRSSS